MQYNEKVIYELAAVSDSCLLEGSTQYWKNSETASSVDITRLVEDRHC